MTVKTHFRLALFAMAAAVLATANAKAQDAEPRLYSNTPVGLNFLIGGSIYAEGKLAFDPELAIADADFESLTGAVAYVRALTPGANPQKSMSLFRIRAFPHGPWWRESLTSAR